TGVLEMTLIWTVHWPDGQTDEANVNGTGECANFYTCNDGELSPPRPLHCWPRFPTPEVTTEGTTQTLVVPVQLARIVFDPAILTCGNKVFQNPINHGGALPSDCDAFEIVFDHLTHDCQACCGTPGPDAPASAEQKTSALEIVSVVPLPHGGQRVSLRNGSE